ncbi:MAG: HD domain-containing protein, partial [Smithella sp.]|nr:HD domain-containing protein [Smithella sp.]
MTNPSILSSLPQNLAASISAIEVYAERILRDKLDPHFTDHSINHSNRIIAILNHLLFSNRKEAYLSNDEKYVLLAACYLHDIGMQNEISTGNSAERRDQHHMISSQMIKQAWRDIGILDAYVDIIANVVEGHRGIIDDKFKTVLLGTCQAIRCDLLAALLQLGDELDISHERVDIVKKKYLCQNAESDLHFYKHYYTLGVGITERQELSIAFRFPVSRSDQYFDFFNQIVLGKIKKAIESLAGILSVKNGIYLLINDENIVFNETDTVESIPAEEFEAIVNASLGVRHFRSFNRINFQRMV